MSYSQRLEQLALRCEVEEPSVLLDLYIMLAVKVPTWTLHEDWTEEAYNASVKEYAGGTVMLWKGKPHQSDLANIGGIPIPYTSNIHHTFELTRWQLVMLRDAPRPFAWLRHPGKRIAVSGHGRTRTTALCAAVLRSYKHRGIK